MVVDMETKAERVDKGSAEVGLVSTNYIFVHLLDNKVFCVTITP